MSGPGTTGSARGGTDRIPTVDLADPAFKADPFPFYARLRAEAPVLPVPMGRQGTGILVTRYDDVAAVLKDDRLTKDHREALTAQQLRERGGVPRMFSGLQDNLLGLDGEHHQRLRALVHRAFTPRRVDRMRDLTQQLADQLVDQLVEAARRRRRIDLIADYALPLPLTIIGRILGVPDADHRRLRRWMNAFIAAPTRSALVTAPRVLQLLRYLRGLVAERTAEPREDLTSALVAAREGDDRLTADEVLAMIFLLLSAGHETTVNLIGSGALALMQHPDQVVRLNADPALVPTAVEELLRFVVPAETATQRWAREDLDIAGTPVPQGSLVVAVLAAANRDPAQFDDPDSLDIGRTPNRHLAFGHGAHYCLGAPLSRMEGAIALETLFRRVPDLQPAVPADHLRWRAGHTVRGLAALPVRIP